MLVVTLLVLLLLQAGHSILTSLRMRDLQTRNDSLSDTLTRVVELASEERLSETRKHADEREKLRLECMLQLDSMHRTTSTSFTQLLLQKLSASRPSSQTGSDASEGSVTRRVRT